MPSTRTTARAGLLATAGLLAVGCAPRDDEPPAPVVGPQKVRVRLLVQTVEGKDARARESALGRIETLGRGGLSPKDGTRLLRAAARLGRPDRDRRGVRLVAAAARQPRHELIPIVAEVYPKLGDAAKVRALDLLGRIGDRPAAEAQMALIREYAQLGAVPGLGAAAWQARPRFADVFFPDLLYYLDDPGLSGDVGSLALAYLRAHQLAPREIAIRLHMIRKGLGECRAWYLEHPDDLSPRRQSRASALIMLLNFVPGPEPVELLVPLLDVRSPVVRADAVAALLARGEQVPRDVVESVAADLRTRAWLFYVLRRIRRPELFPEDHANQVALAESELYCRLARDIGWKDPPEFVFERTQEIAPAPDLPGLDTQGRVAYLFRFRKHGASDWRRGWVVYPAADRLLTHGDAGSDDMPWGDPSPMRFGEARGAE